MVVANKISLYPVFSRAAFLVLFSLVLFSCYRQSKVFFNEIDLAEVEADPFFFANGQDTLFARGSRTWPINLDSVKDFYGYEILLDDELLVFSEKKTGNYTFNTANYVDGFYSITLNVYKKSNTGSLADQLGYEALVLSITKVLIIGNNMVLEKPQVAEYKLINNDLYVRISPYSGYDFNYFKLWLEGTGYLIEEREPSFFLLMENYDGSTIDFTIGLSAMQEYSLIDAAYTYDANYNLFYQGGTVYLTWDEIPFPNSVSLQLAYFDLIKNTEEKVVVPKGNLNTSIQLDLSFPYHYTIKVAIVNASGNINRVKGVDTVIRDICFGNDLFLEPFQVVDANHVIIYQSEHGFSEEGYFTAGLNEIIFQPTKPKDSLRLVRTVSNIVFSENKTILYQNNGTQISKLNPTTLDVMEVVDISQYIDSVQSIEMIYPGNNELLAFLFNNVAIAVFDWNDKQVLNVVKAKEYCVSPAEVMWLSNSGTKMPDFGFRGTLTGYTDLTPYPGYPKCYSWFKLLYNDVRISFAPHNSSYWYEIIGQPVQEKFIEPYSIEPYIEYNLMYVLGDDGVLRIHNLDTGQVLNEIPFRVIRNTTTLAPLMPGYRNGQLGVQVNGAIFLRAY